MQNYCKRINPRNTSNQVFKMASKINSCGGVILTGSAHLVVCELLQIGTSWCSAEFCSGTYTMVHVQSCNVWSKIIPVQVHVYNLIFRWVLFPEKAWFIVYFVLWLIDLLFSSTLKRRQNLLSWVAVDWYSCCTVLLINRAFRDSFSGTVWAILLSMPTWLTALPNHLGPKRDNKFPAQPPTIA